MDILIIPIILLPLIAQWKVKSNYNKYLKKKNNINMSGAEAARKILDKNGLNNVDIIQTDGLLSDHYNPTNKTVALSKEIYTGNTIASIAVAAHEVGHAIQHKEAYSFLTFRTKMVPIVNFSSRISSIILALGFFLGYAGLIDLAIALLCISLLFQLVTLPVEFNASSRAKIQLEQIGLLAEEDTKGVHKMLSAAAFTYVASFLASALQVLRLIAMSNRRR
jgi:Zn-dependent membrane protease YugP